MTRLTQLLFLICILHPAISSSETITLKDCLSLAATANHTLKVAAYDEKIAHDGIVLSKSGYYPRIDIQGGYTAQLEPQSIEFGGRSIATQGADFAFFTLSLYQTLYDFGRTSARAERARTAKESIAFSYTAAEQEIFLQVVTSYYSLLLAQQLLSAANEEVSQMEDHRRVANLLYEQGVVTKNDLLQAEVRLSSSRQQSLAASNRLDNSWLNLNYLTGRDFLSRAELVAPLMSELDATMKNAPDLFNKRAEILAQQKAVETSAQEVKETRENYYPEFFAKLGLDYVQNRQVKEQAIMAATVGLKVNLYDGEATTSRYRQAIKNRSKQEERLRLLSNNVQLEYQTAVNDAKSARERTIVLEKAIEQSEENLRINRDRYQAQVGTATDVIDAQMLLTQAKTERFRAVADYQVALARVKRALGEL
jgi:outer membrane protein TolC